MATDPMFLPQNSLESNSELAENISLTHKVVEESIKVESSIDRKENYRNSLIPGQDEKHYQNINKIRAH